MSKTYGMEIKQQHICPAAAMSTPVITDISTKIYIAEEEPVVLPAELPTLPSIILVSKQDRSGYAINPSAIQHSGFLTSFIDFKTAQEPEQASMQKKNPVKHIVINLPSKYLRNIVQLLQFLHALYPSNPSIEEIQQYIQHSTNNFSTITIAQLYKTLKYFIMPDIILHALTSMQQPLPLPTSSVEEIAYNQQISAVFHLAQSSCSRAEDGSLCASNIALWQLFGHMLSPHCLHYPEIEQMITCIQQQKPIKQAALDAYMQSHPELYKHLLKTFIAPEKICSIACSPDGKKLAAGTCHGAVLLWDIENGSLRIVREGERSSFLSTQITFSPDSRTLACGSWDGTIRLLTLADNSSRELARYTDSITALAFSTDGRMLAWGSLDHTIQLWNIADGLLLKELRGHAYVINSIAFSPDGETLASLSGGKSVWLWNIAQSSSRKLLEHMDYISSIAFTSSGKVLASGLYDGTIQLWNIPNGLLLKESKGYTGRTTSVAFGHNNRIIASETENTIIKLWGFISLREALIALSTTPR
jgi:WD40 repeat protein